MFVLFRGSRTIGNNYICTVKSWMFRGSRTTGNILYSYELDVSRVACDREQLGVLVNRYISRVTYDRKYICTVMVIDVLRVAYDRKHEIEIHLDHFVGSVRPEMHGD